MGGSERTVEKVIARLASRTWGVVTRAELLAAGITEREIDHRLGLGALIRLHPGVYRVGHMAPSTEATYLAAVSACGDGALLSGHAAAHLLGVTRARTAPPPEVTSERERRVRGVRTKRTRGSLILDAMTWRGIPVTTVARTIVDLASSLSLNDLSRVCHEAGVKHKTTPGQVKAVLERRPNAKGAGNLRLIFEGDAPALLSRLEERFRELLAAARLPLPEFNRPASGRRIDCRWDWVPLTVELDSYTFHHSRHAWEQDRRREREARARGDEFRRYTWGDVFEEPRLVLAELRPLLAGVRLDPPPGWVIPHSGDRQAPATAS
jgi:hypothetical protein